MQTFRVSAAGRLYLVLQAVATGLLLFFAAWFVLDTLGLELARWSDSWQTARSSWTSGQLLPAFGLLVVVLAGPFLLWQTLAEAWLRYRVDDHGLYISTIGLEGFFPWEQIQSIKAVTGRDEVEAFDIIVPREPGWAFRKRVLQLHGRIPIHPQMVDRERFLHVLRSSIAQA